MQKKIALFIIESVALGLAAGFLLWLFLPGETVQKPAKSRVVSSQVSYHRAVEATAPAVVNIYTSKGGMTIAGPSNLGSGVIIDERGYIVTNDHVIRDADEIAVALQDGRTASAKVMGRDPETDLAVLSIDLKRLPTIRWGQSDKIKVGDVVLAIGNAFGVGQTVTMGIISGTGRNQLGLSTFEDFIQTDAAINPGNSGGALVNTAGEMIGINTAIFSRSGGSEGVGFAIPANLAKGLLQQIIEHGKVARGWLGVVIQDLTPDLAESFNIDRQTGVLVAGVIVPGPANEAGLKVSDIILKVNAMVAENTRVTLNKIASFPPGSKIKLTILREGKQKVIDATVAERPQFD